MATKYAANWYKNGASEGIALFSDEVPREVLIDFLDSVWANCAEEISRVEVVDEDTGEVIHDRESWDTPDNYEEDCDFDLVEDVATTAKKEIKYKNIHVGRDVYTVKMQLLPQGGAFNGTAVKVEVMAWHLPPRNFWERLTEFWHFSLSSWTWDPQINEASLEAFIIDKCVYETDKRLCQDRGMREWEVV